MTDKLKSWYYIIHIIYFKEYLCFYNFKLYAIYFNTDKIHKNRPKKNSSFSEYFLITTKYFCD